MGFFAVGKGVEPLCVLPRHSLAGRHITNSVNLLFETLPGIEPGLNGYCKPTPTPVLGTMSFAEDGGIEPHPIKRDLVFKTSRRTAPAASSSNVPQTGFEPVNNRF